LTEEWKEYKAAKEALENTLDLDQIEVMTKTHLEKLESVYEACNNYLIDGVLTEEYVLEKSTALMNCLRDANITVKWLMLHRKSRMKKIREIITRELKLRDILSLLLVSAKFENKLNEMCESLINSK
jgi:WASH complex subunit strumpellin